MPLAPTSDCLAPAPRLVLPPAPKLIRPPAPRLALPPGPRLVRPAILPPTDCRRSPREEPVREGIIALVICFRAKWLLGKRQSCAPHKQSADKMRCHVTLMDLNMPRAYLFDKPWDGLRVHDGAPNETCHLVAGGYSGHVQNTKRLSLVTAQQARFIS
jgi:hypothetical protein